MRKRLMPIIACLLINMCAALLEQKNWAFHFPDGSNMAVFIALAIPIEVPNESVFIAYNFEVDYVLPGLQSEDLQYPPLVSKENRRQSRKIDRSRVYKVLETKLEVYGYPGYECVLRMICEATISSFEHNGILGDIIHVILTPSTSINLGLSPSYLEAESYGQTHNDCRPYEKNCKISFLDIITWFDKMT